MASSSLGREQLSNLSRPELQKLAKDHNIKANLRTDQLVDELIKQNGSSEEKPALSTRSQSASSQTSRRRLRKSFSQPAIVTQNTVGHLRTSSKELHKPSTSVKLSERKPVPVSGISRIATMRDTSGKENGHASAPSTQRTAKPSVMTSASTSNQKGLAGKISAFGRSIGGVSKQLPERTINPSHVDTNSSRTKTSTFAHPTHSSQETRIMSLESAVAELLATTSSLKERLTAAETEIEAVRQEAATQKTALASRDEEIEQLKAELQQAQETAQTTSSQNSTLREELDRKSEEMIILQRDLSVVTESTTQLKAQMEDFKDTNTRVQAAESTLSELSNRINNRTPVPRHVADGVHKGPPASPSPFNSMGTRLTLHNYAALQHGTHSYLNLELNSSPSGRRRKEGWEELGHDMLLQYNGFGRQCLDSPKNGFGGYM